MAMTLPLISPALFFFIALGAIWIPDISWSAVWHLTKLWKSLYFPVSLVPLIEQMLKRICESLLDSCCVRAHSLYNSNALIDRTRRRPQLHVTRDDVDLIWGWERKVSFLYLYYFNIVLAVLKDLFKNSEMVERNEALQKLFVSTKQNRKNQGEEGRALT